MKYKSNYHTACRAYTGTRRPRLLPALALNPGGILTTLYRKALRTSGIPVELTNTGDPEHHPPTTDEEAKALCWTYRECDPDFAQAVIVETKPGKGE